MNHFKPAADYFQRISHQQQDGSNANFGKTFSIAVLAGDSIGAEVTIQAVKVLEAVATRFGRTFEITNVHEVTGYPLTEEAIGICAKSDAILFGAIGQSEYSDTKVTAKPENCLLKLIKTLNLFLNITPVSLHESLHHLSPLKSRVLTDVDFVIYSELIVNSNLDEDKATEDKEGTVERCIDSNQAIERIAQQAFQASGHRRKKLTFVEAFGASETSKRWRKVLSEVSIKYPAVKVEYLNVDEASGQLILNPKQFDVVLADNYSGGILSKIAGSITGSQSLLPCAFVGVSNAMLGPAYGNDSMAAGKDIANPLGAILSAAMLLDYLKLTKEATLVRDAVEWTIQNKFVTKDIDPINFYFTSTIGELIAEYVQGRVTGVFNQENIELRKSTII